MELVDGGTLRDVLRARGALGLPAAVRVLEPVLAGWPARTGSAWCTGT